MELSVEQYNEFVETFDRCRDNLIDDLDTFRDNYMKVFIQHQANKSFKFDFNQLAKDVFLYRMNVFYESYSLIESGMSQINDILKEKEEDEGSV
jgi:hypothetical protein